MQIWESFKKNHINFYFFCLSKMIFLLLYNNNFNSFFIPNIIFNASGSLLSSALSFIFINSLNEFYLETGNFSKKSLKLLSK